MWRRASSRHCAVTAAVVAVGLTLAIPATAAEFEIPEEDIERIGVASVPAGMAVKCGLDWESYYLAFMARERRKSWTQKQLAFIGALFGFYQSSYAEELPDDFCSDERMREIGALMAERRAGGVDSAATAAGASPQ